jgi:hypothetical protein
MNKIFSLLLTLTITTTISLTAFFPVAVDGAEFNPSYGGSMESTDMRNKPVVTFSLENNTVIYKLGNFNVGFTADITFPDYQTLMVALYSVSYKTSWQNNPTFVYQWSINDPSNPSDDDVNPLQSLFYAIDLTNVPEGPQHIEVTVNGGGYVSDLVHTYWTVSTTVSSTFNFNISTPPTPTLSPPTQAWHSQIIDSKVAARYLGNCPIVVDSNNAPHIAYTKRVNEKTTFVMYASWNHSFWSTQTIASGAIQGLVLDANDNPHLLCGEGSRLTYAAWTGTKWVIQSLDTSSKNSFGAIALDSSGKPHVAYNDGNALKLASWTDNNWSTRTIDSLGAPAVLQFSLAFDKNNIPYLLYGYYIPYESKTDNIVHYTKIVKIAIGNASSWSIQTIPLQSPISGYGNIVLDSKGFPHFIYAQNESTRDFPALDTVCYCSWNGTIWSTQNVDSNVSLVINTNIGFLTLDSYDNPHITYTTADGAIYASRTGNKWNIQTVETEPLASYSGFLALDSNGNPYISYLGPVQWSGYFFLAMGPVVYATRMNPIPTQTPIVVLNPIQNNSEILLIIVVVVASAVITVSIMLFRRRRKTTRLLIL